MRASERIEVSNWLRCSCWSEMCFAAIVIIEKQVGINSQSRIDPRARYRSCSGSARLIWSHKNNAFVVMSMRH